MDKVKIAIWGITDEIWKSVYNSIDFSKAEIIFFIDNDPYSDGIVYEGIRIYNFSNVNDDLISRVDYILVAAYSAYSIIRKEYIESGKGDSYKLQLYITERMHSYPIGKIYDFDYELLERIYFDKELLRAAVDEYIIDEEKYSKAKPVEVPANHWSNGFTLISHACGGIFNGRKMMYSNSGEALNYTMDNDFVMMECDVVLEDGRLVLSHQYNERNECFEAGGAILFLEDIIDALMKKESMHVLLDIKWKSVEQYAEIVDIVTEIIEAKAGREGVEKIKGRVIMEAYNEETIAAAKTKGYDVFYTQYRNPNKGNYLETVNICVKYNVAAVGFGSYWMLLMGNKPAKIFNQKNIKVFIFSTNSINEYRILRKQGVSAVFTDYMRP